jgi:hypothetical protein
MRLRDKKRKNTLLNFCIDFVIYIAYNLFTLNKGG